MGKRRKAEGKRRGRRGKREKEEEKGETVVIYREPSATKEMRYPRLSRRVNKTDIKAESYLTLVEKLQNSYLIVGRDIKNCSNHRMTH